MNETPKQTAHRLWARVIAALDATEGELSAAMDAFCFEWGAAQRDNTDAGWRALCSTMAGILRDAGETVEWMERWEVA